VWEFSVAKDCWSAYERKARWHESLISCETRKRKEGQHVFEARARFLKQLDIRRRFCGEKIAATTDLQLFGDNLPSSLVDSVALATIIMMRYTTDAAAAQSNGTPSPFVTLVSSDGFEFHVRRSAACVSGTIRRMLDPQSTITNILINTLTAIIPL
jgi:hypothetical protein